MDIGSQLVNMLSRTEFAIDNFQFPVLPEQVNERSGPGRHGSPDGYKSEPVTILHEFYKFPRKAYGTSIGNFSGQNFAFSDFGVLLNELFDTILVDNTDLDWNFLKSEYQ